MTTIRASAEPRTTLTGGRGVRRSELTITTVISKELRRVAVQHNNVRRSSLPKKRRRSGRLARHLHHHRPGPRPTHPTQRLIVAHLDIPIPWPETRPAATTSDQPSHDLRLGDHPLSVLPGGYRVVVPSGRLRPP